MTAKFMFASFVIRGAINGAKQGFQNLAQYSGSTNSSISMLMSSLTQLKNSLAAAFAPILEVVAPILNSFVQMVIRAVNAVGQLIGALSGKTTIVTAKKLNQDYGYNVKLTKRPINSGITCRQVLSYAMQMICKFAKCDANGKLIVDWFDQQVFEQNTLLDGGIFDDDSPYSSGDEADGGTFSPWNTGYEHNSGTFEDMDAFHHIYTLDTLDVAVEDVIISGVQVTAETENTENADTLFYGEEGYVLKISGNPFIIKENAANFAEYLGKKLIGLIFRPLDASALPNPTVEAGDIAYISDGPSKSYSALVTNLSFDPDDNMSISCDAESPKKTESQRPTELEQTLAKMRKETENTLSNYDLIVQQMSQLAANTLGFHETKIIQDDRSVIVYRHDKPKLSESKIVYKSGIDGFFVTKNYTGKDSTTVWKAGFDSNGNAALNILSVIGIHWDWASGGTLSLGGKGNGNGVLKVFDENGKLIGQWDRSGIVAQSGKFSGDITGASGTFSGKLNSKTGNIAGWNITEEGLSTDKMKIYSNKSINDDYDPDNPFDDGSNDYTHIYRDAVSTNEVSAQKFSFAPHRGSTYYKERTANINIVTDINGSTATYTTLRYCL